MNLWAFLTGLWSSLFGRRRPDPVAPRPPRPPVPRSPVPRSPPPPLFSEEEIERLASRPVAPRSHPEDLR